MVTRASVREPDRPLLPEAAAIALASLVRARWFVAVAELAAIVAAAIAQGEAALPLAWMGALVALTLGTNLVLARWLRHRPAPTSSILGAVLALDTVVLTGLLAMAGGAANPFTALYMLEVTLAAVVLGPRWSFGILSLSALGFASLFALPSPPHAMHAHAHGGAAYDVHLYGMLVAFTATAALSAHLVARITRALAERDAELAKARAKVAKTDRLAALSTLAAGAAHELGTPLGTIGIAADELLRGLSGRAETEALRPDVDLIRSEIGRCRGILDQMAARAGEAQADLPAPIEPSTLLAELRGALRGRDRERVRLGFEEGVGRPVLPRRAIVQALSSLLRNALEASQEGAPVRLDISRAAASVRFVVEDGGIGMEQEIVSRAGEPFFTTKADGHGLGLYLVQSLADRLGGSLGIESAPGRGTTVTLEVPA